MKIVLDHDLVSALAKYGAASFEHNKWREFVGGDIYKCIYCSNETNEVTGQIKHSYDCIVGNILSELHNQPTRKYQQEIKNMAKKVQDLADNV